MFRIRLLAGAMLALVIVSSAQAQLGRGINIPPVVQNLMLMRSEPVQKELKLDDSQGKAVNELAGQMQSEAMEIMSGLQDLTPEEQRKEIPSLMKMVAEKGKALQDKVDKILNAEQKARMHQLSLQRRGVEALQDEAVIEALKLSDDQKKKLTAVREEAADKQQEIIKEVTSGGDRSQIREKFGALRKESGEKAMAILSSEQREAFEKMKGAKFDFPQQRGGLF
jgi:hypothetical protein